MLILRVFFYFLLFSISPISNEFVYEVANEDENNDLLSEEYDYNSPGSEQDDLLNMYSNLLSEPSEPPSKISQLIASIRESSVDILQDIGDLEDLLKEHDNASAQTTPKPSAAPPVVPGGAKATNTTSTTGPSGKLAAVVAKEQPKPNTTKDIDVLEEGKAKLKLWDEQIKTCKAILEHSKLPRADGIKPDPLKEEEQHIQPFIDEEKKQLSEEKNKSSLDIDKAVPKPGEKSIKSVSDMKKKKKHSNEVKESQKLRRKRRRLLQESMENFRQVYR